MKFIHSSLVVSLLIVVTTSNAYACDQYYRATSSHSMFRLSGKYDNAFNETDAIQVGNNEAENCRAWQKITSKTIALDDIYKLVYQFTVTDLNEIKNGRFEAQNSFAQWIMDNQDYEIVDFLILAKTCEQVRAQQNSPWYYPAGDDEVQSMLVDIAEQAMLYEGRRLCDRYVLQALRAMFALRQYDRCINYYNDMKDRMPSGVIKEMAEAYLAGANSRTGNINEAMTYYARIGDIRSLVLCGGEDLDRFELIKQVYTYDPNSPALVELIEGAIRSEESRAEFMDDQRSIAGKDTLNVFTRLRDFAIQVGDQNKVKERAMWYYTAAFIADMQGDSSQALTNLRKAEKSRGNSVIEESIKVFRIFVDAKNRSHEIGYEQLLYGQLQWLDNKIIENMPNDSDIVWYIQGNRSCHYWNDMLRRILLSEVCPRMVLRNKTTCALQLTNMADYILINALDHSGVKIDQPYTLAQYRNRTKEHNYLDYSSSFFVFADKCSADQLIAYKRASNNNGSGFNRFVNSRSFVDENFLNDLIGTKLLHEMRYAEAERFLQKVPFAFQYRLNTDIYMRYDPFSIVKKMISDRADYKYRFAAQMRMLANEIKFSKDPNRKALSMIRFAVGLRNSISQCWVLTRYHTGRIDSNVDGRNPRQIACDTVALSRSNTMIDQALIIFTDVESAAVAHRLLYRYKTVVDTFPDTRAAIDVRNSCDTYKDYSLPVQIN